MQTKLFYYHNFIRIITQLYVHNLIKVNFYLHINIIGIIKYRMSSFLNFEKITKVIIPENVEEIRARAFSGCRNLKEIILPSTLKTIGCCEEKTCYKSIPDIEGVFRYCGIETISIPSSVTTIGDGTFYYCRNLKEVVLPDSVQMLGKHAFDFSGLEKIKLSSNLRVIKTKTFKIFDILYIFSKLPHFLFSVLDKLKLFMSWIFRH